MSNGYEYKKNVNVQMDQWKLYDTSGGETSDLRKEIGYVVEGGLPIYTRSNFSHKKKEWEESHVFQFESPSGEKSYYEIVMPNKEGRGSRASGQDLFLTIAGTGFDPDVMKSHGMKKMDFSEEELKKIKSGGQGSISKHGGGDSASWSSRRSPAYFETEEFRKKHPHPGTTYEKLFLGGEEWREYKGEYPGLDILKGRSIKERLFPKGIKLGDQRSRKQKRNAEDKIMDGFLQQDNKYKMGE